MNYMGLGDFTAMCVDSVKNVGPAISGVGKGFGTLFGGLNDTNRRT